MYDPGEGGAPCEQIGKIKIEGITICVNYSDFLSQTIENNLKHLDRLVVVTDTKDELTKELCDRYDKVTCVRTDVFYEDGAVFNKGKGINAGLAALSKKHWVLHFDADIWFAPHLKEVLNNRFLDKRAIYGIDRLMCHGWPNWQKFLNEPKPINELYYLVQARAFPIGSRVAHYNQPDGWFPIGFFQLWNPKVSGIDTYPTEWAGADHTDVVFAKTFPRGLRHLIPETYVIHLDSQRGEMGLNWNGRKSEWFGPQVIREIVKEEEVVTAPVEEIVIEKKETVEIIEKGKTIEEIHVETEDVVMHITAPTKKTLSFLHKYIFKDK